MTDRETTLIFVHVPKTGGTTLTHLLRQQFDTDHIFEVNNDRKPDSIREFAALPNELRSRIRLVTGHIALGFDRLIPGAAVQVTMLREPAEQWVSSYFYLARAPKHPRHEKFRSGQLPLDLFVEQRTDNPLTRWFLSTDPLQPTLLKKHEPVTEATLELALANLRNHCDIIGLLEFFDLSLLLIARRMGRRVPASYEVRNATKDRPQLCDLPPSIQETIERKTFFDRRLYAICRERFWAQVSEAGPALRCQAMYRKTVREFRTTLKRINALRQRIRRAA